MDRKLLSWALIINSKLKVAPSQSVNSPSWLPVSNRRPPGVQLKHSNGDWFFDLVRWAMYVR